nr:hypothetical protein [Tanacetum cinerariifolium]
MGGYKQSYLNGKSFDEIKELFDREMRKVNDFVAMDSEAQNSSAIEAQEGSTKRTAKQLESDISKKQKVDENVEPFVNDSKELRKGIEIVADDGDEVLIEATPISSRSPTIIDYKIHKEGKKTYFKIIRADVKDIFEKEKPVDDMDNILFRTLKTMFKHHVEDTIWKYQQGLAKVYPLTRNTLYQLWSDVRLQVDYDVEIAYDLLRFIKKQLMEASFDFCSRQDESRRDHSWFDNENSVIVSGNKTAKDLWDALERQMRGSEYGEQDRKVKQYGTLMRQTKNLIDINIDALYNILKQNQGDVNDSLRYKKKAVVVTSDPLALVAEKMKVSKQKEKVVVSLNFEGSSADDFLELKKITALLAKAFKQRKFYSKPTNNNLRTSSTSYSTNKKQEFVKSNDKKVEKKDEEKKRDMSKVKCYNCKKEGHFAKDCKKAKVKDYNYYKTKMLLAKKNSDEQVLLDENQAWMESNESSSSAEETIAEVAYYTSESESEYEFATLEYYDNSTNYGLFVNNDDDQEFFHDAIESASENFIENHIDSQKDYDKSEVDHNDFEEKEHLVDKLFRKFNHNISKCQKRIEKANQQRKDLENQNKDLQEKHDVLINQVNTFEDQNNEFNEQIKVLNEKNVDLLAQTEVLQDQLKQTSSLKPYVPNVILKKIIIDLEDEVVSLLEKEKANLKTIESLKSKGFESSENAISETENQSENDCQVVEKECDKVDNPRLISPGMFKLSASQSVSPMSMSKTSCDSKNVENLLSCNNSHLRETSSAYVCNDAMNVSCNSRMCDLFDENNLFIFDDESVRISPVSKMPFRKNPRDSKNICLWIIDSGCSKHMMGNRALLTNFVEKFLGTVHFGNNDFAMIAGYGDVVIRLMTIKKVYYVEGLGHNLFSVRQFCDKVLEVAFRKSTCFVRNEDVVDLLTSDRSSNLYTIALNEVTSNSSTFLLAKASSSKSWLWHQRHLCSAYEQGKIHRKHHMSKTAFASIKPLYFLYMDLCGSIIYNKQTRKIHDSVNLNFNEISEMASKQFSLEPGLSNLNETGKYSNPSVSLVSETSKKDLEDLFQKNFDEYFGASKIMKSSTTNVETSINEEVFHEDSESFQGESSSSSLNDDVQQSPKEVILPQTNTQSISNNMIPNVDKASTSHNVFNERLEDAYFDASASFHDRLISIEPANVAEALKDADWVSAMLDELDQFARFKV